MINHFKITPAAPDGICVKVVFMVDTWDDLKELMENLEEIQ